MVAISVLSAFLIVIAVDLIVLKVQRKNHPAFEPSFSQIEFQISNGNVFTFPSNIFFSKGHTWHKKNKEGLLEIGIDPFGWTALGALSILKCAEPGAEVKRGTMLFEGCYGNKNIKFLSPVSGIIKSVNNNIIGKKISDPFAAWGIQLISKDSPKNKDLFFIGIEALNWMKNEFSRLKTFIETHSSKIELAGETMYDGGSLSNDLAGLLDNQSINDFEKEFLSL